MQKCSLSHTMERNKANSGLSSKQGKHHSLYFPDFEGKSKGYLLSRA